MTHLMDPRSIVPQSVMPGYPFLATSDLDYMSIAAHLRANRKVGVPYTDEQVEHAVDDLRAQVNPDEPKVAEFQKRYPKAVVRDFDGNPGHITEMDALVGYLQMLGTLVDFKLYDDKANLR